MGYWQTRFEQLEKKTFQITKQNSADIQKALIAAERSIKKDINNWIVRFAKNNEVSIVEARKMLNNDELKEFKWDVKEFIKYGEENALNQEYMKELENASARFHISRLEAIELSIRNEFEKAYKIQDDKIRQNVLETYDDRYYRTCYEVQSKFGIGFDVSGVDTDKVKKLISKPWASDNKTFSDRVWTKKNEMIDTLRSQLIRTCATGGNIQDAVNSMMSFVSKDVKNARYAATRLLQTETAFFSSVSEKKALKDLDVEQYEILATLDSKTSPICQEMDGQVFKLSEYEIGATAPPFHVNCRSTTCPHFDDEYGERIARDRAGNTYMVPGDMTYKEWRVRQEEVKVRDNIDNRVNIPKNYHEDNNEIAIADTLARNLDANVELLKKSQKQGVKNPDAIIDGVFYEFKTPKSIKGVDSVVRTGLSQVLNNGGKIVVDIKNCNGSTEDIIRMIQHRVNRSLKNDKVDIILVNSKTNEILSNLEYKKIRGSFSHQNGVKGTSLQQNNTIKNDKSQLKNDDKSLKNEEKGGKIYIRKAKVVDGKDLVGEVEYKGKLYRTNGDQPTDLFAIDEIVEKQGFNGLPTIINDEEELKKLTNEDTLLGERTIRANNKKDFEKFKNDLLNKNFYINCATGGAQYGQGMYFAGDYTKGKIGAVRWQHEIDQYGGNAEFQKTFWLTLYKDIKSIDIKDVYPKYMEQVIKKIPMPEKVKRIFELDALKKPTREQIIEKINIAREAEVAEEYNRIFKKYIDMDRGVMAAEMGYDMIEAKDHGTTGSYNVLLNRTKLIVIDKDIKSEEIEKLFKGE